MSVTLNPIGTPTITLGGTFTTSGANPVTLTTTGSTNVTLPTSGTLCTTVGSSSIVTVGTVTTGTWSAGLKDYTETTTTANSTATYTINLANGNWFELTLTANCTLAFSNVPATAGQGVSITLALIQDATGSRTVTWPASVDWGTTGAPTLTTTANKVDLVTMITANNGTRWRAFLAGKGFGG